LRTAQREIFSSHPKKEAPLIPYSPKKAEINPEMKTAYRPEKKNDKKKKS